MTALQILDRSTGEIIGAVDASSVLAAAGIVDVRLADMDELAGFIDDVRELKAIAVEASNLASDETIRRLDRNGKWTWRDDRFEVKAASPEAGTTVYDTSMLREALTILVSTDVISAEGAIAALEPIKPTAPVPYGVLRELHEHLVDEFEVSESLLAEVEALLLAEPNVTYKQHPAGIKALLKIPAAKGPIEACRELVDAPRRTAKVRRIA